MSDSYSLALSSLTTTKSKAPLRHSKTNPPPHERASLVCGCRCFWWRCSCWHIPAPYIFLVSLLLSFSSHLTFCVASLQPISTSPPTAPPPLKSKARDLKLIIAISFSGFAVLLILGILLMGCLKFLRFRMRRRKPSRVVDDGDDIKDLDVGLSVRKYGWEEIARFTMDFSRIIGSGGFSTVYLAQFPRSNVLGAVKVHSGSERLHRLFRKELDILLQLRHDNIVKFLGYCDDQEEGALVFECIPNGNLQEKLHGGGGAAADAVLPWQTRMKIAFQLAQAIEYLHEKCALQIVHGDIKASNILLDEDLNCKLCDFGSAKMGFSSTVTMSKQVMVGSPGYTDPHYLRTGIAAKKNDVYSFGVIVLELVTGMEAFCSERGMPLTQIAGSVLVDVRDECKPPVQVAEMVDPRLEGKFDLEEARAMLSLSALCLLQQPTLRPSATQILDIMKDKISSISFSFSSLDQKGSRNLMSIHKYLASPVAIEIV